jgi:thiamine pyrophosphate-dependent acetolactate synthase large subunit-like protein
VPSSAPAGAEQLADALRRRHDAALRCPGRRLNLDVVRACEAAGIEFVLVQYETAAVMMAGVVGE